MAFLGGQWGLGPGARTKADCRGSEAPLDVEENEAEFSNTLSIPSPPCQGKGAPSEMPFPARRPPLPRPRGPVLLCPRHSSLVKQACDSQVPGRQRS